MHLIGLSACLDSTEKFFISSIVGTAWELRLIFTTTICAFQAFFVFHFCGLNSCFVVGEHPVTSRGWGADSAVIPTVRVLLRSGGRVLYSVVARVQERGHHTVHTDRGDQDYLFIIFIYSCTHQSKNTQD